MEEWFFKIQYAFLMCKLSAINKYRLGSLNALKVFSEQWECFVNSRYSKYTQPKLHHTLLFNCMILKMVKINF